MRSACPSAPGRIKSAEKAVHLPTNREEVALNAVKIHACIDRKYLGTAALRNEGAF